MHDGWEVLITVHLGENALKAKTIFYVKIKIKFLCMSTHSQFIFLNMLGKIKLLENKTIAMMGLKSPPSEKYIFHRKSLSQTNISKGSRGKDHYYLKLRLIVYMSL